MAPNSFVLDVATADRERRDTIDVYRSAHDSDVHRRPAIVFVHGAPLPPDLPAGPRDWPIFVGYGSLAAACGAVGITFQYHLRTPDDFVGAANEIAAAVEQARSLPDVDPNRVALWFFSGGGLLAADWLRNPPSWVRCIALNYPIVEPLSEWGIDARFRPIDVLGAAGALPILLVRAELERPDFAAGVANFVVAAGANLEIVEVAGGYHGFDALDPTPAARDAVTSAMAWGVGKLE